MTRKIRVIETGEVYDSMKEAAKHIGGTAEGISRVIRGHQATHMGFTFAKHGLTSDDK